MNLILSVRSDIYYVYLSLISISHISLFIIYYIPHLSLPPPPSRLFPSVHIHIGSSVPSRRLWRRCLAPQSSQDFLYSSWGWRSWYGPCRGEKTSCPLPAIPSRGPRCSTHGGSCLSCPLWLKPHNHNFMELYPNDGREWSALSHIICDS